MGTARVMPRDGNVEGYSTKYNLVVIVLNTSRINLVMRDTWTTVLKWDCYYRVKQQPGYSESQLRNLEMMTSMVQLWVQPVVTSCGTASVTTDVGKIV